MAITDTIQLADLVLFGLATGIILSIAWRYPRYRIGLLPILLYTFNGFLFYIVAVGGLLDSPTRTLWSATLRLQGALSLCVALCIWAKSLRRGG